MAETIAIIDYGSGNLRSVEKAFERAARESGVAARFLVTDDADAIAAADRIVLPGVGAFGACMAGLSARDGVLEALEHGVLARGRPFLGICVGMQLLADCGLEFGEHEGLGWISGRIEAIEPGDSSLTTPHMGWNTVEARDRGPLASALNGHAFYFAHSYHFVPENAHHVQAVTHHGVELAAAVGRDNIFGLQCHPEKSQSAGLALLAAFLHWTP